MSIEIKQKIKEVADDFQMPAKQVIEIVGKFFDKPKSSSQNLSEDQLNVVFDYITKNHQIDSLEQVFAVKSAAPAPAPAPAPAQQPQQARAQQQTQPRPQQANAQRAPQNAPARPAQQPQQSRPQQQSSQPARPAAPAQQAQQPAKPKEPERKRERRVIDTSAVTVNADRYDDRVDSLVSERVQNYKGGKQ